MGYDKRFLYDETDLEWILKTPQRQTAYRFVAAKLCDEIQSGVLIDAPAKLARILELVFEVGLDYGAVPPDVREKAERRLQSPYFHNSVENSAPTALTEGELPHLVDRYLSHMKLVLGRDIESQQFREATPDCLVMIMRPGQAGGVSSKASDKWFNAVTEGQFGWSNKAADYLVATGLYEVPVELDDGWKVSRITEWGFELFATGRTKVAKDRCPGGSTTFMEYASLTDDGLHELFANVCELNGFSGFPPVHQPLAATNLHRL